MRAYCAKPGNGAGGHCHIALDDGNLSDDDLRFCLDNCEQAADTDGATLMRLMLQMSPTQRRHVRECA